MKKLAALALALACAFCFSACGNKAVQEKLDVSLVDVKNANRLDVLAEDCDRISVKEERININGDVYSTVYWDFRMEDGKTALDTEAAVVKQGAVMNAREGVFYDLNGENMTATIIPEAEYEKRIKDMLPFLPSDGERLVSVKEMDTGDEILLETSFEDPQDNAAMGGSYYVDADSLQIERVQIATYDEKGFKTSIRAMTVACDGGEGSDTSALAAITEAGEDELCAVTVVINPGSDNEETRTLFVVKGCGIDVLGRGGYSLYRDEACQIQLPSVDTMGDSVTVYAKPFS